MSGSKKIHFYTRPSQGVSYPNTRRNIHSSGGPEEYQDCCNDDAKHQEKQNMGKNDDEPKAKRAKTISGKEIPNIRVRDDLALAIVPKEEENIENSDTSSTILSEGVTILEDAVDTYLEESETKRQDLLKLLTNENRKLLENLKITEDLLKKEKESKAEVSERIMQALVKENAKMLQPIQKEVVNLRYDFDDFKAMRNNVDRHQANKEKAAADSIQAIREEYEKQLKIVKKSYVEVEVISKKRIVELIDLLNKEKKLLLDSQEREKLSRNELQDLKKQHEDANSVIAEQRKKIQKLEGQISRFPTKAFIKFTNGPGQGMLIPILPAPNAPAGPTLNHGNNSKT